MNCEKCGAPLQPGAAFCGNCGAAVPPAAQQPVNQQPAQPQYNQPAQPQYNPSAQPQYNQPAQPQYNQPGQAQYGQPGQAQYGQPGQAQYGQPGQAGPMPRAMFDQLPPVKKLCKNILGSAITLYICAVITLLVSVLIAGNIFGLLDVALLVGLGLGVQLARNRACAVILLVYGSINMLLQLLLSNTPGGYLVVIAGIYAVIATFRYWKAWNTYLRTGQLPVQR